MSASSTHTPARRAPDNELYDRGCDLVEAAAAIRRVAGAPEARASAAARSLAARALAAARAGGTARSLH